MQARAIPPAEAGIKVGDFFCRSWGYDQTNVNFYKVVGLTPKGVRVQEWSSTFAESSPPAGGPVTYVVPGEKPRTGCWLRDEESGARTFSRDVPAPIVTKRLSSYGSGDAFIAVGSYNDHARKWDGSAMYETGFGWGH